MVFAFMEEIMNIHDKPPVSGNPIEIESYNYTLDQPPSSFIHEPHTVKHFPTEGSTFFEKIQKIFHYIISYLSDITASQTIFERNLGSPPQKKIDPAGEIKQKASLEAPEEQDEEIVKDGFEPVDSKEPPDASVSAPSQQRERLFQALTLESQIANAGFVEDFMDKLSMKNPANNGLVFLQEGLHTAGSDIRDPYAVIAQEIKNGKIDPKKSIVVFPYVYGDGKDHIVLVVVDFDSNQISYYDPQGKTADDINCPMVGVSGTMNANLEEIAKLKTEAHWKIYHNVSKHQTDAINCGYYVMRALLALSKIPKDTKINLKEIIKALSYDASAESGTQLRKRIGRVYGVAVGYENKMLGIDPKVIAEYPEFQREVKQKSDTSGAA